MAAPADAVAIRDALVRQWRAIARALPARDLDVASRIAGWRNREVVAHLTMQPALLVRFLGTAGSEPPRLDAVENLSGTRAFAELIDDATRRAVDAGTIDFAASSEAAIERLAVAELDVTVTTLQGPIPLADYLVTRCVEAVVHGRDLVDPVEPDPEALRIVAVALTALLARRDAALVAVAESLPPLAWVAMATGRAPAPASLARVVPLMA
ncbi:MAG TPA: maleylpyruvate isomerase N-terminal domain-containing protein [Acidimicrobiia bacterium]